MFIKKLFIKSLEFGYEPKEICESGIVAVIEGKKPGKTFLLRADVDAPNIISYEVPSVYFMLRAGTKKENFLYGEPMHNSKVFLIFGYVLK